MIIRLSISINTPQSCRSFVICQAAASPPHSKYRIVCNGSVQEQACSTCMSFRFFPVLLVIRETGGCGKNWLVTKTVSLPSMERFLVTSHQGKEGGLKLAKRQQLFHWMQLSFRKLDGGMKSEFRRLISQFQEFTKVSSK